MQRSIAFLTSYSVILLLVFLREKREKAVTMKDFSKYIAHLTSRENVNFSEIGLLLRRENKNLNTNPFEPFQRLYYPEAKSAK